YDGEPPTGPQEQLHLILPAIQEDEDVSAQRVSRQRAPDLVGQAVERLVQVRRRSGDVHAYRPRQQHHGVGRPTSRTTAATHAAGTADTSAISISTPPARRKVAEAPSLVGTTTAGTNP